MLSVSGFFFNAANSGDVAAGILRVATVQWNNPSLVMVNVADAAAE